MSAAKRTAASRAGTSKKPRTAFKLRPIESVPGSPSQPPNFAPNQVHEITQETESFQVYSLEDGRLGMRHGYNTITIPVTDPSDSTSPAAVVPDGMVSEILGSFPLEHEQQTQTHIAGKLPRRRPEQRAAAKIYEWLPLRDEFLDELLCYFSGEFPVASADFKCQGCNENQATYRCTECENRRMYCAGCIAERHIDLCLHRLEFWNGKTFLRTSLRELGMVIQLGHDGDNCTSPSPTTRRVVVVDITGVHEVQVRFCQCLDANDQFLYEWIQLFRYGWFPATTLRPSTAFTFRMLDTFQELNFQGKTNLYDYCRSLERITSNSGAARPPERYKQASHAVRLWRHLVLLKRSGRAHDPEGVRATKEGDLAVECPACPHPGKNIPDDWESADPAVKWLYTLFLMMDANFRAKLKDRKLDDVELGAGWSYFVHGSEYTEHVRRAGTQTDRNTCSAEHKAIMNANLRREGYIASGVGAVLCARHALIRKLAAGDIPNGEKFAIMDYLYFSTLIGLSLLLMVSYDIACQWHKKLASRVLDLPSPLQQDALTHLDKMRFAIPKKHLRVHGPNHSMYSLNLLPKVGRTYGEGIEAQWAHMNPIALSTREMGPGMRHEVMSDHWGAWNWQKVIGLGTFRAPSLTLRGRLTFFSDFLLKCLRDAEPTAKAQRDAHAELAATIPHENIAKWEGEVAAWNASPSTAPDPYEEPRQTATLKSTRLRIAEEEAAELAAGTLPPHDVTPGVFLQIGLELEEQQRSIRSREKRSSSTPGAMADVQEKRTALRRRIELWQAIQDIHMPIVPQVRASGLAPQTAPTVTPQPVSSSLETLPSLPSGVQPPLSNARPEDIILWLPSALPPSLRTASLLPGLMDKERRLRIAQADDALEEIRRMQRILTGIKDFKYLNTSGTGQRTEGRVRSLFTKFVERRARAAEKYRAARAALVSLDASGDWTPRFKALEDNDLRGPHRDPEDLSGDGRYQMSWIWVVPRSPGQVPTSADQAPNPSELIENMKIEWARSKARAERWEEEVQLLQEEMRRVVEYFDWKAGWWRGQAARRLDVSISLQRGLAAYAESQALVLEGLAWRCAATWIPYLRRRGGEMPPWTLRYKGVEDKKGKGAAAFTGRPVYSHADESNDEGQSDTSDDDDDEDHVG